MRPSPYRLFLASLLACLSVAAGSLAGQESSSSDRQAKRGHGDDFLVRGTVFTEKGLALPGAQLRIRRAAEKKFRWDAVSNSRGDFAVRVKTGAEYEVVARAKGYADQSASVNAKTGERYKDLVFRMHRPGGKKP
jgi:Carboxypeptidase regulatory-like domain